MLKKTCLITIATLCFLVTVSHADKKQQAINLVNKAIAHAAANGIDAAFAEMNKSDGMFTAPGGLYVFAYDLNATIVAHYNSKIVGKNYMNKTDPKGSFFRREIVNLAKSKGDGWVDYTYIDKNTKKIGDKTTYIKKYKNLVFCCGFIK